MNTMTTTVPLPWYTVEGNLDQAEAQGIANARVAARTFLEEGNTLVEIYADDGEQAAPVETARICSRTGNVEYRGIQGRRLR